MRKFDQQLFFFSPVILSMDYFSPSDVLCVTQPGKKFRRLSLKQSARVLLIRSRCHGVVRKFIYFASKFACPILNSGGVILMLHVAEQTQVESLITHWSTWSFWGSSSEQQLHVHVRILILRVVHNSPSFLLNREFWCQANCAQWTP